MWMIMAAYSNQAAIASMLAPSTDGALVNMLGQLSFTGKRRKSGFHPTMTERALQMSIQGRAKKRKECEDWQDCRDSPI